MTTPPQRTRWRRRAVVLAALSIVLGFLTTWAVAWGCGVYSAADYRNGVSWCDPDRREAREEHEPGRSIRASCGFGVEHIYVTVGRRSDVELSAEWLRDCDQLPRWSRTYECWRTGAPFPAGAEEWCMLAFVDPFDDAPVPLMVQWQEASYGWPARCLSCYWPRSDRIRDGYSHPRWLKARSSNRPNRPVLPFRPYWPGLVVNVGLYSAVWMPLLTLPWMIRQASRLFTGRCPSCGYDIRSGASAGCPECGWGRVGVATDVEEGDA